MTIQQLIEKYEMEDIVVESVLGYEVYSDGFITICTHQNKEAVNSIINKMIQHRKMLLFIMENMDKFSYDERRKISKNQLILMNILKENPQIMESIDLLEEGKLPNGLFYVVISNDAEFLLRQEYKRIGIRQL